MQWPWFNLKIVSFWQPILSVDEQSWRDEHVWAHILGGGGWIMILGAIGGVLGGHWSLLWHPITRITLVGVWQATGWEWTQRENWRPELQGLKVGHGYPVLSGVWDTLFALVGAAAFEGILSLLWGVL